MSLNLSIFIMYLFEGFCCIIFYFAFVISHYFQVEKKLKYIRLFAISKHNLKVAPESRIQNNLHFLAILFFITDICHSCYFFCILLELSSIIFSQFTYYILSTLLKTKLTLKHIQSHI